VDLTASLISCCLDYCCAVDCQVPYIAVWHFIAVQRFSSQCSGANVVKNTVYIETHWNTLSAGGTIVCCTRCVTVLSDSMVIVFILKYIL